MDTHSVLKAGDVIGFTFFTGYMSMLAASIFFFMERGRVAEKWKTSLLVSGLITFIASVHYYYMRDIWLSTGTSPTEFRYIDWVLTVPLMCVEFYLLLKPAGAKASLLYKMFFYSILMLVAGYIGEGLDRDHNVKWGVISTIGYLGIVYEIVAGEAKALADSSRDANVQKAFGLLRRFVLIGWAIYPIGYMCLPGNLLSGFIAQQNLDLFYNIGDAINKIGFGFVVYAMAMADTSKKA